MRGPAAGGVGQHSGGWWAASAAQATRRKKSTSFWSRTSIPITSAASQRRTESGSFPMPMFTSRRPKATFGCRRKSLLRRRRMRSRSSRVRKPSQRRIRHCFLPWVACARTGVGIAGCRWYLPIDGTRTAKGGLTMRNRITAFALMTQIVVPALPIIRVVAYAQQSSDKPVISLSTVSKLDRSQAGIYRTKIGKIDVIAVSDGTVGLGLTKELVQNAKPGEVERLLAWHFEKSPLDASINAFLIKYENKLLLIDTGATELVGPTAGKLPQSLRAAGAPDRK